MLAIIDYSNNVTTQYLTKFDSKHIETKQNGNN
jgi:hypothetical protein